jgi:hypothetical protein
MVDGRLVGTHPGRFDDDMLLKLTQAPRSCEQRARGRANTRGKSSGKYHPMLLRTSTLLLGLLLALSPKDVALPFAPSQPNPR